MPAVARNRLLHDMFLNEDREKLHSLWAKVSRRRPDVRIMEVCGTHTMSIARSGLLTRCGDGAGMVLQFFA